ncbi:Gfo/Idh/MocA family oxidoreductase [Rhizobium grahamii]|uniref:Gfo/Idh/MocA family oxidoreductase n=1 Tax=Rhizobium grahamii TaxID=1120045 RepID=A0A5Q0C8X9_9HYPH|nr:MULTISPECIES: Gfo/Idh/MocA family oxidoreductase [Rhizobium]QFY60440.1 Gfo/Idh/MocA family oxidoreductase [Rhizobium grahamii]QRM50432.1 Gfo/Idh/MocA family oxidoreductase [Rhizobium sp. BG6]
MGGYSNPATQRPLRLGMVGGGRGSLIGGPHRLAARLDGNYTLSAGAFSSNPEISKASGADLGIDPARCYGDFSEMARAEAAREDGIEVVSIVTPNHLHAPAAKAFLAAGIHVICDKPLTASLEEAIALKQAVDASGKMFFLTHNYSAYAMVRQARQMVATGELGEIRSVQVEYPSGWMAEAVEKTSNKQASWRTDPSQAGAGVIADIGTHAWHLARTVSGLELDELSADLASLVEGRRVDDHAQVLLRFAGGARGILWVSGIALGPENGLRIRIFGSLGGLEWSQMDPDALLHSPLGKPRQIIQRAAAGTSPYAQRLSRIPAGHPEGYFEAFGNVYRDAAAAIRGGCTSGLADPVFATVDDGVDGMQFIEACLASSASNAAWINFNSKR